MAWHESHSEQPLIVPPKRLSPEALNGIIEEFVTRSGTDYGHKEASLTQKCTALKKQIKSGRAVIICDPVSQTCNIIPAEEMHHSSASRQEEGTP